MSVKVRLELGGKVEIAWPLAKEAGVTGVGHAAAPPETLQLALVQLSPTAPASFIVAPSALLGPPFLTTIEYVVVDPRTTVSAPLSLVMDNNDRASVSTYGAAQGAGVKLPGSTTPGSAAGRIVLTGTGNCASITCEPVCVVS